MEMIEVKTADLVGAALDWAVAKAEGLECGLWKKGSAPGYCVIIVSTFFCPATKWADCGPLIDKHKVGFGYFNGEWLANEGEHDRGCGCSAYGETHLIAACRAIVASVLGETVSVPKELVDLAKATGGEA